jgi:hypothetical protein
MAQGIQEPDHVWLVMMMAMCGLLRVSLHAPGTPTESVLLFFRLPLILRRSLDSEVGTH